jgi:hypothetical protein
MIWQNLLLRFLLSGGIVVAASEIAKRNSLFGALLISLPLASIMTLIWLYHDTGDVEKIAIFSQEVLWLVLPSLVLFIALPVLLTRGVDFWPALGVSMILTGAFYAIGALIAAKVVAPV